MESFWNSHGNTLAYPLYLIGALSLVAFVVIGGWLVAGKRFFFNHATNKNILVACLSIAGGFAFVSLAASFILLSTSERDEAASSFTAKEQTALVALTQTIQSDLSRPEEIYDALLERIDLYAKYDLYDLALQDLTQASVYSSTNPAIFSNRAYIHNILGNYRDAIDDYTKALSLSRSDERNGLILVERGALYMGTGQLAEAQKDFKEALSLNPNDVAAFDAMFNLNIASENFDQALSDLTDVLKTHPNDAGWLLGRGMMDFLVGKNKDAIADLKRSYDAEPNKTNVGQTILWLILAQAADEKGNIQDIAQKAPDFPSEEWPAPILSLYRGKSSVEDVFAAAEKGNRVQQRGHSCEAYFYVGAYYLNQNKPEEAHNLFIKAQQICPPRFMEWSATQSVLKKQTK